MKGVFVTGTDTGVGKTIVVGLLAKYLSDNGFNVVTQKWVQTGSRDFSGSDVAEHIRLMGSGGAALRRYQKYMLPYLYTPPVSPHLASQLENRRTVSCKIKKYYSFLSRKFDFVIVEGVGGALVPYDKKNLVIDIARELSLPVLVVAQNKLGAINHTLLTIEALRRRKRKILGIVFNNIKKEDRRILKDNPEIVKTLSGEKVLGVLSWNRNSDRLYEQFIPIGKKIRKEIFTARNKPRRDPQKN